MSESIKNTTSCKGCGASIFFGRSVNGNLIPIDADPKRKLIYVPGSDYYKVVNSYTSHFETCAKADNFRKGKA